MPTRQLKPFVASTHEEATRTGSWGEPLVINPGSLENLASLIKSLSPQLRDFSTRYMGGEEMRVIWDLKHLESRHISIATLAAFLAIAHRLSRYTAEPPTAQFTWNPAVLGFLHDVAFFEVARDEKILSLPDQIADSYMMGRTNPHSVLLMYPGRMIPSRTSHSEWVNWKDEARQAVTTALEERTQNIFFAKRKIREFPNELRDAVWLASAELVVNALLWGRAPAFVALQRTSRRVTVAVADAGFGFFNTLKTRLEREGSLPPANSVEALLVGSLITRREFGLNRVIEAVVSRRGSVHMSSDNGEIVWREHLWRNVAPFHGDVQIAIDRMGRPLRSPFIDAISRDTGFCRLWGTGLRGSRVSFEIPVEDPR